MVYGIACARQSDWVFVHDINDAEGLRQFFDAAMVTTHSFDLSKKETEFLNALCALHASLDLEESPVIPIIMKAFELGRRTAG